jgi:xanthine dehydrogenase YagT iron-sulfur-binding subunit
LEFAPRGSNRFAGRVLLLSGPHHNFSKICDSQGDFMSHTPPPPNASSQGTQNTALTLSINGQSHGVSADIRASLLDVLREHLHLTGSKKGCDHGQCGACTVLVNGRRINACLTLAVMHDGDEIVTIEGLGKPGALHPMQEAFLHHDAFQCGYCTPGQICSAVGMLDEAKHGWPSHVSHALDGGVTLTDDEISERMSGNLCRCSAYPNIVDAIRDVAEVGK